TFIIPDDPPPDCPQRPQTPPLQVPRCLPKRPLQKARDSVRNTHLQSTRQYSQNAYIFGNCIMKYSLLPSTATQRELYNETVKLDDEGGDYLLHRWLQSFNSSHAAKYLFSV
ncbi:hypothetical protein K432DRAFT_466279, partial [Lepidopterella palustris CBS 459.81]